MFKISAMLVVYCITLVPICQRVLAKKKTCFHPVLKQTVEVSMRIFLSELHLAGE